MTRLLISVRDAREAERALAAGADLIDVKEPSRGSLGAATRTTVADVVAAVAARKPVSVALGELLEGSVTPGEGPVCDDSIFQLAADENLAAAGELPPGVALAKLGLAGCRRVADWTGVWAAHVARLPVHVRPVAVVYADDRCAASPPAQEILAMAVNLGCAAALVDTFDKSQGGLLAHWSLAEVGDFVEAVRGAGLVCVLAGSLQAACIGRLLPLGPDVVAVRGAACRGSRDGVLDGDRVRALASLMRPARNGCDAVNRANWPENSQFA